MDNFGWHSYMAHNFFIFIETSKIWKIWAIHLMKESRELGVGSTRDDKGYLEIILRSGQLDSNEVEANALIEGVC